MTTGGGTSSPFTVSLTAIGEKLEKPNISVKVPAGSIVDRLKVQRFFSLKLESECEAL